MKGPYEKHEKHPFVNFMKTYNRVRLLQLCMS